VARRIRPFEREFVPRPDRSIGARDLDFDFVRTTVTIGVDQFEAIT